MTAKQLFPLLLLCLCIASLNLSAQQRRSYRYSQSTPQTFTVGLAPFSLLTKSGKVNLKGEWAYADNKSVALYIGIPRPTKTPGWLTDALSTEDGKTAENEFKSFGFTIEHRFYLSRNAPRGFYLAPYARYNRFGLERTTTSEEGYYTSIEGSIAGAGIGGSAGWQLALGPRFTLDLGLVGVDFKWMRGKVIYSTNDPENDIAAFRDEIQDKLEKIPIIGRQLAATIDGNSVKAKTPGFILPGYRLNITVNYALTN